MSIVSLMCYSSHLLYSITFFQGNYGVRVKHSLNNILYLLISCDGNNVYLYGPLYVGIVHYPFLLLFETKYMNLYLLNDKRKPILLTNGNERL